MLIQVMNNEPPARMHFCAIKWETMNFIGVNQSLSYLSDFCCTQGTVSSPFSRVLKSLRLSLHSITFSHVIASGEWYTV